jgi:hypothetical protein
LANLGHVPLYYWSALQDPPSNSSGIAGPLADRCLG